MNTDKFKPKQHPTRVIISEDSIPEGYIPLKTFKKSAIGKDGVTRNEHALINKAVLSGILPAVKLMRTPTDQAGPVWVDKEMCEEYFNWHMHKKELRREEKALAQQASVNTSRIEALLKEQSLKLSEIAMLLSDMLEAWTTPNVDEDKDEDEDDHFNHDEPDELPRAAVQPAQAARPVSGRTHISFDSE